ncbi:MAG TPA: STM4011 family radical SAM protein [Chloroflexia bacterium]|nr:STM4011 family radical SAM protein [Chloroflexia bacterium]
MKLAILYRGPLASCNYACRYCPFAKRKETRQEHARDAQALERFVNWVSNRQADRLSVLFTPWGEALIRRRYQKALIRLTGLPQVTRAAIQTNLSGSLDWVEECDKARLALWATYHPSQTSRARFLAKCAELEKRGVRYSVGVVGLKEYGAEIEELRRELPGGVYLWINAYKRRPDYYSPQLLAHFTALDPLFPLNLANHPSRGQACRTGQEVIAVDGAGYIRRCHFIKTVLGNIYEPGFEAVLKPRPCPAATCGCHIGYVHLEDLHLEEVYGEGILERIPQKLPVLSASSQVS